MRTIVKNETATCLPVGGTPRNSPRWVPRIVKRYATRSPSATTSSRVASASGPALTRRGARATVWRHPTHTIVAAPEDHPMRLSPFRYALALTVVVAFVLATGLVAAQQAPPSWKQGQPKEMESSTLSPIAQPP